jgi:uncharacterized protein (TIGR00369 family)
VYPENELASRYHGESLGLPFGCAESAITKRLRRNHDEITRDMDKTAIRALLDSVLAPWVREWSLAPESTTDDTVTLRLPHADKLRHAGGVVCGQVFMAAADTAMVVAISHVLGGFQPMTTVSLNTSFMRPVKAGDVLVTAKVLRRGRNLVFGEIELRDAEGELAAHATTTYALLG